MTTRILQSAVIIRVACLLFLLAGDPAGVLGAIQRYTASASVAAKRSKPTPEETDAAIAGVKRALLAKVVAEQDDSRRQRLEGLLPSLNPDDFFVPGTLLIADSQVNKNSKVFTLVAQVDADSDKFNKLLDAPGTAVRVGSKLWIAWLFAARRQASVKEYDPEVFNRAVNQDRTEHQVLTKSGGGASEAQQTTTKQNSVVSSGGILRKADLIEYVLAEEQRARIDKAMSSTLIDRGLSPVPSSDLQANSGGKFKISRVIEDFKTASDLSDDSKELIMQAAIQSEVDYFATGTVTINAKSRDPSTGNTRIAATLDAQIYAFRKSRNGDRCIGTSVVASTGSRVVVAIGKDQTEAESKAIEEASVRAANVLCDQLRSR